MDVTAVPDEVLVVGTADPEVVVVFEEVADEGAWLDDEVVELVAAAVMVDPLAASVPVKPDIAVRLATRVMSLARLAGCRRLRRLGASWAGIRARVRAPIGMTLVSRVLVLISDLLVVVALESGTRTQGFPGRQL